MVLQAAEDVIPDASTPFLIVDSSLTIQALSEQAERTLGVSEERAVNRHVTELLIPGDAEPNAAGSLAAAITMAAGGDGRPPTVSRSGRATRSGSGCSRAWPPAGRRAQR